MWNNLPGFVQIACTAHAPTGTNRGTSMMTILVVEDDERIRQILVRNLVRRAYQVESATSAEEAIAHLRRTHPSLMILDINLPDGTGWDVLRQLTPQERAAVPAIVLSAVRPTLKRLQEFHPYAFLQKPFPIEALLNLIEQAHAVPQ